MVNIEIIIEGVGEWFTGWTTIKNMEIILTGAALLFGGGITVTVKELIRREG